METLFVYGLVVLFFVLFFLFIIVVLLPHPYSEPPTHAETQDTKADGKAGGTLTYGVFSLFFLLLFALVWVSEKKRARG